MVWIDSYPQLLFPLSEDEPILGLIRVHHTPLIALLTKSTLFIYNQYTLLPVAHHKRTNESIQQHGDNINVKSKHISVNTSQLQQHGKINLFVETSANCLVIYQVVINHSKSMYEVHNKHNDELLQKGLPLSFTSEKFSFVNMIKSATKTVIQGNRGSANLENIEHFNNSSAEDELSNFQIEHVKVSIFKILKIGIGISKYWLKQNSHNVLVFNDKNERAQDENTEEFPEDDNYFQIINIKNFKNEIFQLSEFGWYDPKSRIVHINFNCYKNYILFINDKHEIWYMEFQSESNSEVKAVGHKLYDLPKVGNPNYLIAFNPHFSLMLLRVGNHIKLFKVDGVNKDVSLSFIKDIEFAFIEGEVQIDWSSCGMFWTIFNKNSGYWSIYSKFGTNSFNSYEVLNELNAQNNSDSDSNTNFLRISNIIIASNSNQLILMNKDQTTLSLVNLLSLSTNNHTNETCPDLIFYNNEWISLLSDSNINTKSNFIRFPILPKFKDIMRKIENFNGTSALTKSLSGHLKISSNRYKQLSISYGNHIAVSTPYSDGHDINQILWFNFHNYFVESLNVVDHLWFDDYLILINRSSQDEGSITDEMLVLDASLSKYGNGGIQFNFDSDLIIWRYAFSSEVISYELVDNNCIKDNSGIALSKHLLILNSDLKITVLEISKYHSDELIKERLKKSSANSSLNDEHANKNYKIFIGMNKTVHLQSIESKLAIANIIQINMIENKHFLILLNTGDFYVLKNHASKSPDTNDPLNVLKNSSSMYDLIKLKDSIEAYQIEKVAFGGKEQITYLYLFNGDSVLIYNMIEMIDAAFDTGIHVPDGIDDMDHHISEPISIEVHNFQPLTIKKTISENQVGMRSIDLVGLETLSFYKHDYIIVKNRINHKLIMNNFIEHDLLQDFDVETISRKYSLFENFRYCLELLLFKYLTTQDSSLLLKIVELINHTSGAESIYINCLRKIEVGFWQTFFENLHTTPTEFMNKLIKIGNVELCYNYLIVYLNFKREHDDNTSNVTLDSHDTEVILKIIRMLDASQKWDWCFELCRFIKLLEPSGKLLKKIETTLR